MSPSSSIRQTRVHGVILAAGPARRGRALTSPAICRYALPKAMLPVGQKRLIDYSVRALQELGLRKIYVGTGPRPLSEITEQHLNDLETADFEIHSHCENTVLDTLGTLKYIMQNFMVDVERKDTIVVLPCDTPNDILLRPILLNHLKNEAAVTVAALPIRWSSSEWKERTFGTVKLGVMPDIADYKDRNIFESDLHQCAKGVQGSSFQVVSFCEQEERDKAQSNLISTAIYFFNAGLLMDLSDHITAKNAGHGFSDIGLHLLPLLGGRQDEFRHILPVELIRRLNDYPFFAHILPADTFWQDVGNPLALLKANMDILRVEQAEAMERMRGTSQSFPSRWRSLLDWIRQQQGVSLIDPSALVRGHASVKRSVIGANTEISGDVISSVVFSGGHETVENRPSLRRNLIGRGVKLINSIFVGGQLRQEDAPRVIKDRIVYETVHGGLAFDPL
ncbi:MAG: NDP-sugar synthase [Candidatus Saganbacteria bacterium]|nr:NDP-sugar synthase [Candidatus Saganbacteria bacterium]